MRTFVFVSILLLASCSDDTAKAPAQTTEQQPQATQLRDAVKAPLDKAHEAEQLLEHSTDATDKALEEAGG